LLQIKSSVAPRNPGRADARHILSDHWQSLESTISAKSGVCKIVESIYVRYNIMPYRQFWYDFHVLQSVEDHANLLCSLLLGFGLEAYIAIGTKIGSQPWVWVVTLDTDSGPTFWESTSGKYTIIYTRIFSRCEFSFRF
jgi:hypothetical protein